MSDTPAECEFKGNKNEFILARIAENIAPVSVQNTASGSINFYCPGVNPVLRSDTFFEKEPETLEWINDFDETDIFWDIGANVGVYSLYAALRGLLVLAFEPSPFNYHILSRNIEINKFDNKISAYCVALSDKTKLDYFYMTNTILGGANNSFGEPRNSDGEIYEASLRQAMIGVSIDEFIQKFDPPFPNNIKIDVDGMEGYVIKGATDTLKDRRLKSILIELNMHILNNCWGAYII